MADEQAETAVYERRRDVIRKTVTVTASAGERLSYDVVVALEVEIDRAVGIAVDALCEGLRERFSHVDSLRVEEMTREDRDVVKLWVTFVVGALIGGLVGCAFYVAFGLWSVLVALPAWVLVGVGVWAVADEVTS